ncbi:MAG TPA: preprotein translocase subunit SecE [Gemmataceae bacterium]|nr:preprotein translocase subunit SecE [Gemmataceae bacterium]
MTVAVRNTPEISTGNLFDRLALASLAGVVYVIGAVAIVVKGLPALWWNYLGLSQQSFPAWALLIVAMLATAAGLVYVGGKLLGPHPPAGTRAGIFVGLLGVLLIGWIVRWIAGVLEGWSFDKGWFSQPVAIGIALAIAAVLLLAFARLLFKPGFESFLRHCEDQGWFHAVSYKASQGLKVRRGTMLGVIILVGSGVWSYERSLQSGADAWTVDIPFTGTFTVRERGDAARAPGLDVDWGANVRILDPGDWPEFQANQVVSRDALDKVRAALDNGVKIRAGDADRFKEDNDFVDRQALIVSKQAFDRVQKEVSERNPGEKIASFTPKLPVAADVLDRYYAKQVNGELQSDFVRVANAAGAFKKGDVAPVKEFDSLKAQRQSEIDKLEEEARQLNEKDSPEPVQARRKQEEADRLKGLMPKAEPPTPMEGAVQFQTLTLVPAVRFVMPLVLGALALWFSWRLVNLPPFADFLIATEAELNKVSWTPRRRLVQDTIVVLVTTLLITFFLLFADLIWSQLLTRVGVLRAPKETSADVRPGGDDLPDW